MLPSRATRSLRRAPVILALLLPIVTFLVIGRTVEIKKATDEGQPPLAGEAVAVAEAAATLVERKFGLGGGSSAGAGLSECHGRKDVLIISDLGRVPLAALEHLANPRVPLPQQARLLPASLHIVERCSARLVAPVRPGTLLPLTSLARPAADRNANHIYGCVWAITGGRRMGQSRSGPAVHHRPGHSQHVDLALSR